jgi:5'-nucleotidase
MRILFTNDDGIAAPGLAAVVSAFRDLGPSDVVAPEHAQTGVGHGITVGRPVTVRRMPFADARAAWAVDGRPADCVRLAVLELLECRPDFVISGINAGLNTGMYTLYSGTVAAAAEAAVFFRIPALAISLECSAEMNYALAARIARRIFDAAVAARAGAGLCLNVNIPVLRGGPPPGVRVCHRDPTTVERRFRREVDAQGRQVFWFDGGDPDKTGHPGSDTAAIRDGHVAVTPLTFSSSDQTLLDQVATWSWPELRA